MSPSNQHLPGCTAAAQKWDIDKLFADLAVVKKIYKPQTKELSDFEKHYLCLLLSGNKFDQIASQMKRTVGSIKVDLSNGLNIYIKELTGKSVENWRDPIIFLEEKGYKKRMVVIVIDGVTASDTQLILDRLQEISGDRSLKIMKTDIGSLVLFLSGSSAGCEKIAALFNSGELSDLLGFSVNKVDLVDPDFSLATADAIAVQLNQWWQNIFELGWQSWEEAFGITALNPAFNFRRTNEEGIRRVKLIDWGEELPKIGLVVEIVPESDRKVAIRVQLYPMANTQYLPSDIQLALISEGGDILQEVHSRSISTGTGDEYIQLKRFKCQPGKTFSIQIALGDVANIESFVV